MDFERVRANTPNPETFTELLKSNEQVSKLSQAVTLVLKLPPAAMCDPKFADVMKVFEAKDVAMRDVSALHSLLSGGNVDKIPLEVFMTGYWIFLECSHVLRF